ncbi:hypothetical protein AMAG_04916 [Allomyces macrogynus ATCC 38327]|uniref:Uncharacterized protein n=1 Tax=Allomyces macrogynus (strain ATCC 38327) TaxID=578462 RepID=A0A0L0S6T3_ALLM3|nr:hypothetical protein AMAG_04916 [Allomyces macrogynus ATCC 38327]|eukprot:KNE58096.1 hypothetical protein AMAG_04916 [Allomyces macrogynus ATCC 38327]
MAERVPQPPATAPSAPNVHDGALTAPPVGTGPISLAIPLRASTADRVRAAAPTSAPLPQPTTTQLSTSAGSVGASTSVGSGLLGASWSAASPTAGSFAAAMAAVAAHRRTSTGPVVSPTMPGRVGSVPGVHFSTDALTRTASTDEPAPVVGFHAPAQAEASSTDAAAAASNGGTDAPRGRAKSLGSATMPAARPGSGKGKVTDGKAEHEYLMSQVSFSGGKFWA